MNPNIFREYDIRGEYPNDINEDTAYTLGKSFGSYIKEKYNQNACVFSHDNRLSSPSLSNAMIKGILESGCNVINYGLCTTPMNFFARNINGLFGMQVTASHNPKDDNGFKFSFDFLTNARGDMIKEFRDYTFNGKFLNGKGLLIQDNLYKKYIEYIKSGISLGKKRIKVVVDCGNGTTSIITRKIFNEFNIDFEIINEQNDGSFPNHHPDPSVPENMISLQKKVLETKADLGIAYDGDGDRVGFVKNDGTLLSTEEFMIIIIRDMINNVQNKTFLYDVKCSKSLTNEIMKLGGKPVMYRTGTSYTQAKVAEDNMPFGGEYSGHIFFRDRVMDVGSGIYASLRLVEVLSKNEKDICKLTNDIPKFYTSKETKINTTDDIKFEVIEKIKNYCLEKNYNIIDIDGVRVEFNDGWALVRASNTGPNLIFRAEADTEERLIELVNTFTEIINMYNKKS